MPGLVTYDEVASGEIKHAIRFTAPQSRREFVWPARHYASSLTGTQYPRMGERFRLKASFDISPYPADVQVILRAMKKYGIMLADNGSAWYISGKPDNRWNDSNLHTLGQLLGSNFEAVDATVLRIDPNSGAAMQNGVTVAVSPVLGVRADRRVADLYRDGDRRGRNGDLERQRDRRRRRDRRVDRLRAASTPRRRPCRLPPTVTVRATSTVSPGSSGAATVTVTAPVPAAAGDHVGLADRRFPPGTSR